MQAKLGKDNDGKTIVMVVGGATRDAEVKSVGDKGTKKVTFSLGLGKNKSDEPIYANCDAWGRISGYASQIEKGDVVVAIGKINSYTSQSGKTYNTLNVEWLNVCAKLPLLESSKDSLVGSDEFTEVGDELEDGDDDLPF